jgi:Tol biopolymer transport system component
MGLKGEPRERMARIALLVTALALAGCGESTPESAADAGVRSEAAVAAADGGAGSDVASADNEGALTVVVSQGTNLSFDVGPDADRIAMSVQGVLFTLPAAGGSAQAITDYYQDVREPVWSPDGSAIAYYGYRNGNWDLWSIPAQGGEPEALTSDLFDDREPRYSPDGARIAFSSDRSGNYDVWVLELSDGSLTQITEGTGDEYSPDWSEDGARLAYAATMGRSASEIHVVDLASLDTQLVISEPGVVSGVAWRAADRLSYQLSGAAQTDLRTVAIGGGEVDVLSEDGDDVFPFKAHWTDNGSGFYAANGRIYFQPPGAPRAEIPFSASFDLQRPSYERRRRNHDATAPQPVLGISAPALSPDGEWVSFAALGDLWMWRPADETLRNITDNPFVARTPTWSPDGRQIAYISDKPTNETADNNGANAAGLWIYDIEQQISSRVSVNAPGVSGPSWSPDGQSVAVFTSVPGNPLAGQMIVINLRDGSATPVHKPVPAQPISWSADGAYVATTELAPFSSRYREGVYRLAVMAPDSDERYEIEPVAHRNITSAALTPTGRAMTYVQDGLLWQQNLNENFEPKDAPVALTDSLADTPSWSGDGRFIVYMDADRMFRLDVEANLATDITPPLTWSASRPDKRWTLMVGRLFDGISDDYLENVLVTIDGNRIVAMEPGAAGRAADVDASDKAAYPGLFEMHAHMGETSESQGRTWLAYGITNVRDPGAHPYVAKERQEMWDSGKSIGPRTYTTGFLTDGNRVYYSVAEGITSDEHLERALNRAQRLKLDFIKTYVRLPDLWQRRVVEFAHGIGIPTSSHELFPAVAHGMDHVEHIGGTSRRGFAPKVSGLGYSYDDVVNLLVDSGMGITPTAVLPGYAVIAETQPDLFTTPQFETFYGERGRQGAAMMARMFGPRAGATVVANAELLRELAARDALMVSGTDSPFSPYGAGLHAELRLYALAGLTPQQVLRTATVQAAIAAGVENDLGTLQPGMLADMVIVDGDPLADIADADNVTLTIKNGRAYPLAELLAEPESD